MPHLEYRKLIKVGDTSLAVCLPKAWLRYYGFPKKVKLRIENEKIIVEPIIEDAKDHYKAK